MAPIFAILCLHVGSSPKLLDMHNQTLDSST